MNTNKSFKTYNYEYTLTLFNNIWCISYTEKSFKYKSCREAEVGTFLGFSLEPFPDKICIIILYT